MKDGEKMVEDGTLSFFIRRECHLNGYTDAGLANILFLVAVNDEICNFEWNGKQSEQGMLSVGDVELRKEYMDEFIVRDCNLVAGENTLVVSMITYFPNISHVVVDEYKRMFLSKQTKVQSENYTLSADVLTDSKIVCETVDVGVTEDIDGSITDERNFIFQKLSFTETNRCFTVARDGGLKVEFTNRQHSGEKNYNAVCLILKSGKPIPAWDGHSLLKISLSKEDKVTLPITLTTEQGEHAQVSFVFFDLGDGSSFATETLILFQ